MIQHAQAARTSQHQLPNRTPLNEPVEEELLLEEHGMGIYKKAIMLAENFSSTHVGQYVTECLDKLLKAIEDTAKWSLPAEKIKDESLVRPFNWPLFIMVIIWMRFIRIGLSIVALMIGNPPIRAQDVVYFMQVRRRKLRGIRYNGLKELRRREQETNRLESQSDVGLMFKLKSLLSSAICRPGQNQEPESVRHIFVRAGAENVWDTLNSVEQQPAPKRTRAEVTADEAADEAEHNMTFEQLLNKYANEDSDNDPDYEPTPEEEEKAERDEDELNISSNSDDSVTSTASEVNVEDELVKNTNNNVCPINDSAIKNATKQNELENDVVIVENGAKMPMPIHEIKQELHKDGNEIDLEKMKRNGPSNGNAILLEHNLDTHTSAQKTPTMSKNKNTLNVQAEDLKKTTPGHMSAGNTRLDSFLAATTGAGSPIEINSFSYKHVNNANAQDSPAVIDSSLASEYPAAEPDSGASKVVMSVDSATPNNTTTSHTAEPVESPLSNASASSGHGSKQSKHHHHNAHSKSRGKNRR